MTDVLERADAKKPYGDVAYADPGYQKDGKKRYPLTADKVKAAWSYINQPDNAKLYTPAQLKAIKGRIRAAMVKFGHTVADMPQQSNSRPADLMCVRAFEFESRSSDDGRTLEGYAAVFNQAARIQDMQGEFDEVILPGAFTRSLERRTPVLQFEHGRDPRVGAVPIGAIQDLREDEQGLYVRARLFDNATVEPVRQAIAERAITGMSFRFSVPKGGDTWSKRDGTDYREIGDTDTREIGPVVFPAYDQTTVSVRSLLAQMDPAEHRSLLRELAAELRAIDDFTGVSDARSSGRGDAQRAQPTTRQRLDDGALRLRGILR